MMEPLFVGPREAAKILGVGRNYVYDLVKARELPSRRVGRRILIPRHALVLWAAATQTDAAEEPE